MSVSVSRFLKAYPEFKRTEAELVEQNLTAAEGRIATAVWGDLATDGIMVLAAHLLSMSPEGEQARLKKENRATVYERTWVAMKREVTMGVGRVI